MDKITYLAELAEGLARWVPERERQDILRYYAEYFEEAGPEREAEVVQELGDPWALSCRLAVEGGFVSQEQANAWTPKKRRVWPWVLLGVAAVLVFTIGSIVSAVVGLGWNIAQMVTGRVFEAVAVQTADVVTVVEDETAIQQVEEDTAYYYEDYIGGSVEPFASIDVNISLGNITVVSGNDYTVAMEQSADLSGYGLTWEIKNGTLKLKDGGAVNHVEVNNWNDFKNLFGMGRYALEVTITVPEDAVLDKVSVQTGLGNVTLWDVSAEKVAVETGVGDVECYNFRQVKKMDVETGVGNVTLSMDEPCSGVEIDLESGTGNVEVYLGCPEAECEYELGSGMGNVMVDGVSRGSKAERKGNMPYKLDAESGTGVVNVSFYGD